MSLAHCQETRFRNARTFAVLVGILALLFSLEIWTSLVPLGRLEEHYTDHIRHFRYVQAFFAEGFKIYAHPMSDLAHYGDDRCYAWPQVGYVYPPGALAVFAPFSILYYNLGVSLEVASRLCLIALCLLHHLGVWLLVSGRVRSSTGYLFAALYYLIGLFWALNGQFEAVPLLLILVAANYRDRPRLFRALLALAFFTKPVYLVALPFFLFSYYESWRQRIQAKLSLLDAWPLFLIGLGLYLLKVVAPYISPEQGNPIAFQAIMGGDMRAITCAFTTAAFVALLIAKKEPVVGGLLALQFLTISRIGLVQDWYLLIFFVIPVLLQQRLSREIAMCYVLVFCYFYGALNDPWRLFYLILEGHHT